MITIEKQLQRISVICNKLLRVDAVDRKRDIRLADMMSAAVLLWYDGIFYCPPLFVW